MSILNNLSIEDELKEFFSYTNGNILNRRESGTVEFKEIFNWENNKARSKYIKTMGAFANTEGGLMIFGIGDSPRKIVGISNFDSVDDAEISEELNNNFNREIKFRRYTYTLKNKGLGIIHVLKSAYRPIICTRDSSAMKKGEIYYRYNSRTDRISAGDLSRIIDEQVEKEKEKWVSLLNNIAKIGIDKVGFMNLEDGDINFAGNRVIIDESLLSELKIIDEYSIVKDGAPALELKGTIDTSARIIKAPLFVQIEDVYKAFLNLASVYDPLQYIKVISSQQSRYIPIWFLLRRLGETKKTIEDKLNSIKSTKFGYETLLERLRKDKIGGRPLNEYTMDDSARRGPLRKDVYQRFIRNDDINFSDVEESRTLLEALTNLNINEVGFEQVQQTLGRIFTECYPFEKEQYNYLFRRVLTLVDYLYFSDI